MDAAPSDMHLEEESVSHPSCHFELPTGSKLERAKPRGRGAAQADLSHPGHDIP